MKPNSINDNKTFAQFAEAIMDTMSITTNCIKIGEIVSFDKADQTATVRILHRQNENYDLNLTEEVDYPLLGKVPVVILQGGGAHITFPINAGDQCLLLFSDYMIDNWWVSGDVSTSDFPRRHDLSDAIAIVGLNALPKAIQDYSDYLHLKYDEKSDIVIGKNIDINNDNIHLNGATEVKETLEVKKDATFKKDVNVEQTVTAKTLNATTAANGTFLTVDNKTVTVVNGIVTVIQ